MTGSHLLRDILKKAWSSTLITVILSQQQITKTRNIIFLSIFSSNHLFILTLTEALFFLTSFMSFPFFPLSELLWCLLSVQISAESNTQTLNCAPASSYTTIIIIIIWLYLLQSECLGVLERLFHTQETKYTFNDFCLFQADVSVSFLQAWCNSVS